MSFIELLRKSKAEALGSTDSHALPPAAEPWVEQLRRTKAEARARCANPWMLRINRVRGKTGYDGVERISTQALFDYLEVPQRGRNAAACRRLAKVMRELGWTPIKARGLGQSGFRDQVRGYARDKRTLSCPRKLA
jgi:hypothetical protein